MRNKKKKPKVFINADNERECEKHGVVDFVLRRKRGKDENGLERRFWSCTACESEGVR